MSETPLTIAMVCFANICRSPYAELRARQLAGDAARVSSAGIQGFAAHPMDDDMADQLRLRGVDPDEFRSRRLTRAMVEGSDLILTMEARQRSYVLDEWPAAMKRTLTLSQFAEGLKHIDPAVSGREAIQAVFRHRPPADPALDVSDPYRQGPVASAATAELIDRLLAEILPRLLGPAAPEVVAPALDAGGQPLGLARVGVLVPDVLLPRPGIDLSRWAVVACDQFTSQRDYWQRADEFVGDAPSTLRLVFPEAYLEDRHPRRRIAAINAAMTSYLEDGLFVRHQRTLVLLRRTTGEGVTRWGLMAALDLDAYDWHADSRTLIRATEGTIEDRIPPRKAIRRDAPLELPHIMVLISDPARTVIEPLAALAPSFVQLYETDLMAGGGRLSAWAVDDPAHQQQFAEALTALADALDPANPLLFAMGDGNHSLATAKSLWEDLKPTLGPEEQAAHPARFALVELENIFDEGLAFEPIHRVLFGVDRATFEAELARHCGSFLVAEIPAEGLEASIADQGAGQAFGHADATGTRVYRLDGAGAVIAAGTLQHVIDALVAAGEATVDYIHGTDVALELGQQPGNLGLLLPPIAKESFFASIVADGALPRKTFSMGHAEDKRYYLEARAIR